MGRDPTKLKPFKINLEKGVQHPGAPPVKIITTDGSMVIPIYLLERGLFSGEPMMMQGVNHRDLDTMYWSATSTEKKYNMIQSLMNTNNTQYSFGVGNQIAFQTCAVSDQFPENEEVAVMRSTRTLSWQNRNGQDTLQYIFAQDRFCVPLSYASFARLLEFFNMKWYDADDNPVPDGTEPSLQALATFTAASPI